MVKAVSPFKLSLLLIKVSIALLLLYSSVLLGEQRTNPITHLTLASRNPIASDYYIDLINQSLNALNHPITINRLGQLNYQRQIKYFEQGKLSLIWRMGSKARDDQYLRVNVPLTEGRIAQRLLLINPFSLADFNKVKTAQDFNTHSLIGAFGENWFDAQVWQKNNLPYVSFAGDLTKIYTMLANGNRGFNYFSRGVSEIEKEQKQYPHLIIEPNLLLSFNNDMYIYVHKNNTQLHNLLTRALSNARQNGLINQLMLEHFGDLNAKFNLNQRTHIKLELPPS